VILRGEDGVVVAAAIHRVLLRRRWPADGGVGACSSASENKGGGPKVLLVRRWRPSCGRSVFIWPEWFVPEDTAGGCNSALMSGVRWIRWYSIVRTNIFYSKRLVWRERREALLFVTIK
jgi:hypothetical protein